MYFCIKTFGNAELINVGSGQDVSIRELVSLLVEIIDFKGEITWDHTKPNGTPKRPLDYTRIESLGWQPKYSLREGLEKSYEWYKNIDLVRHRLKN